MKPSDITDEEFIDGLVIKKGLKVRFGLEAQGHIPVIEEMLDRHCCWKEINEAIGWAGDAAQENYIRYLRREIKRLNRNKNNA